MKKNILFLLFVFALSGLSFGQNQTTKLVGNHSFIAADKGLNEFAQAVNSANEIRLSGTGTRTSSIEAQGNYETALTNYLFELEKLAQTADALIKQDINAEILLVKELQMQLHTPQNR